MRIALAIAALLLATSPAIAKPIECVLWPRSAGCQPAPAPVPAPAPKATAPAPAPKVDTDRPMPRGPAVVKPQTKPKAVVRVKVKAKPKAAKPKRVIRPVPARRRVVVDEGPDLPWPCWMVRLNAAGKTAAELRAEGVRRGITASRKQCRQAQACLGRNLSC